MAIPTLSRAACAIRWGRRGRTSPSSAEHAEEVLPQDLPDVAVAVAAGPEGRDEQRQRRRVFHGHRERTDPVEVAPQPHMVNARHADGMLDVVHQTVDPWHIEAGDMLPDEFVHLERRLP